MVLVFIINLFNDFVCFISFFVFLFGSVDVVEYGILCSSDK